MGTIKSQPNAGVQSGLDELVKKTTGFSKLLQEELALRNLNEEVVLECLRAVYHQGSKVAHGNTGSITLYQEDFRENGVAAFAVLLKIQEKWTSALQWKVVKERGKEGK